jgi:putative cell wall-binding protein
VTWLAVLLAVALAASPAAAHPVVHPGEPRIVNLRPAPGDVVGAGRVVVAALAAANVDVVAHRVVVDGQEVAGTRGEGSHPTVSATVDLSAGDHVVQVRVTDAVGRTSERAWRFSASDVAVDRLAGQGRVETAVAISRDLYPGPASAAAAVLARADDYPDALAGVPLAQAVDGPLLLSGRDRLSPVAADELRRVLPPASTVYLLGGESALSPQVAWDVMGLGFLPERLAAESRHGTAAAIAELLPDAATAVLVSGRSFADALAASAPAAIRGWPILLTEPEFLPAETRQRLSDGAYTSAMVIGGRGAVGEEVLAAVGQLVGHANRIAGPGRYDTAAAVVATFFDEGHEVGVASGQTFPDALAGGRHAAGKGMPLVLAARSGLFQPQLDQLGAFRTGRGVLYGGEAALSTRVAGDVRRARLDAGGPRVTSMRPAAGVEMATLDEIVLGFDRNVALQHSVLYVQIDGHEVPGSLRHGEFADSLVFTAAELPATIRAGVSYGVNVTGAFYDGSRWRHIDHRFSYRKLDLSRGDSGPPVRDLQERLTANGYWIGSIDGVYGTLTHQAVMAFQKVHGLPREGVYDMATRQRLESNPPRPQPRSGSGRVIEIDLERQVLMVVSNGHVDWVFNTSTGHGRYYQFGGRTYRATTSTGIRRITRQIDGMREAERGLLWRPKYFDDSRGIAIHGSTSVPAYPASAGCVRVTYPAMDFIWNTNLAPLGTTVWVYPENYYG